MTPKLIKTAADHAVGLARLAALMDRDPAAGTPEADELELLAHLIEDYEKKHFAIGLPDPVSAITFRMEQQGLKMKDLVPYLGTQSRVSEVLSGKRGLTVEMIRNLHEGLGISMEVLIQKPAPPAGEVTASRPCAKALKEMCARGYFAGITKWEEAKTGVERALTEFFASAQGLELSPAYNRQMLRDGAKEDQAALRAWKLRVLQRAAAEEVGEFDATTFTAVLLGQLAGLSRLKNGPAAAVELLRQHGIVVIVEPHLSGTFLDGAALLLPGRKPVIALTLRHDRLDNFWFCFFHELGHVLKHLAKGKADEFLDDLDADSKSRCEVEADDFAYDTLVPRKDWERFLAAGAFDDISVRREAKRLLIDASILAGRVRRERNDFSRLTRLVGQGQVRKLFAEAD